MPENTSPANNDKNSNTFDISSPKFTEVVVDGDNEDTKPEIKFETTTIEPRAAGTDIQVSKMIKNNSFQPKLITCYLSFPGIKNFPTPDNNHLTGIECSQDDESVAVKLSKMCNFNIFRQKTNQHNVKSSTSQADFNSYMNHSKHQTAELTNNCT